MSSEAITGGGPRLWLVLARAHGALADYIQRSIASTGLGLSDFMVLEALLHKGPQPISEIGRRVLLANASMTSAVDRLERRGLVVRQSSATDRRARVVTLTEMGRELIAALYTRHARDIERLTDVLSAQEQVQLHGLLKKLGLAAKAATEAATEAP